MSYTATIENGIIKLPPEVAWADGTKVRIERLESSANGRTVALKDLIGSVDGDGVPATNDRVRRAMRCKP